MNTTSFSPAHFNTAIEDLLEIVLSNQETDNMSHEPQELEDLVVPDFWEATKTGITLLLNHQKTSKSLLFDVKDNILSLPITITDDTLYIDFTDSTASSKK